MYKNTNSEYPIKDRNQEKNFPMNKRVTDKSILDYTIDKNRYVNDNKCSQNLIGMIPRYRPIPNSDLTDIHSNLLSLDRKLSRVPEKKKPSCYTSVGACLCKDCIENNCGNKIVYYRDPVKYKNCGVDETGKFYCE